MNEEERAKVFIRDKKCVLCGSFHFLDIHHCFKRSEYFEEDRNEAWNLVLLCRKCHEDVHIKGRPKLNLYLKNLALKRYRGKHIEKLQEIICQKKKNM